MVLQIPLAGGVRGLFQAIKALFLVILEQVYS
jgi:hypothetical protein